MEKQVYQTAVYLRLSKDDERDGESYSISNQRQMLTDFVNGKADLELSAEFVDDGYSGYDFNRPKFQEMMKAAKNGEINCIVVKDFSRLGRNFQKTEEYMQRIFPALGIRFISVMDCYDNDKELSPNERLLTPLVNLANEFVVMETSEKIRSVLETKRQNGQFIGNHTVYGYLIKDRQLVIDEKAAEVVRKIFDLKIEGKSNQAISDYLNSIGVASPLEHRIANGNTAMGKSNRKGDKAQWVSSSVRRILENPIYTGTLIQGKTTSASYRNRTRIQRDPSELTAFDNAHDAIISDTVFLIVQDLLKKDNYSKCEKKSYLYTGIAFCGNCGTPLYHRQDKDYPAYWLCKNTSCPCKGSIKEIPLTDAVFKTLKTHISLVLNPEEYLSETTEPEHTIPETELKEYETEILRAENAKEMLLIQKEKGTISQADCDEMMCFYNDKIRKAKYQIEQIHHQKSKIQNCISEVREQYRQYAEMTKLTRRLLVTFIEKIEVFSKTKIRIYFRYADFFKEGGDGNGS